MYRVLSDMPSIWLSIWTFRFWNVWGIYRERWRASFCGERQNLL